MSTETFCLSPSDLETPVARDLHNRVSPERWIRIVDEARERLTVVEAVKDVRQGSALSQRKSLKEVAPNVSWSRYQSWCRRIATRSGPLLERLMDQRVPPTPETIPESIRQAATTLRLVVPSMDCETARGHLKKQFGRDGNISDTSLRRIWSAAGLTQASNASPTTRGKRYDGGGGLAFILAAATETGAMEDMAKAALEAGRIAVKSQGQKEIAEEPEGRDERGRLTAAYNHAVRENVPPGEPDSRHGTDAAKRQVHDLSSLATLRNRAQTLEAKLLSTGVLGLLTERRGFQGLEGPRGALLGLLDCVPYLPPTLNKCLAELALLGVGDALWGAHARKWNEVAKLWSEPGKSWLQMAIYVDTTTDPYWTTRFAAASKVSQVGRVMPCLSRVYVHAGPGVPLTVETFVGTVSLKKQLVPTLQRLEEVVGQGELGRLTIVDAESATFETLSALAEMPNRLFITVWKGRGANPKRIEPASPRWRRYRKRDRLRDGKVTLHWKNDSGEECDLALRAVEMQRKSNRHSCTTIFLTNDTAHELTATQIADAYLSRWPNQEHRFRNGRNGMGTDRSHGYGGENVLHVALETALEESKRKQESAEARVEKAQEHIAQLEAARAATRRTPQHAAVSDALNAARKELNTAKRTLTSAANLHRKNESTSRIIYKRDTTRDSIVTAAVMCVTMLSEFVLKEYFSGLKMESRTFIEHFINAPTTMIITRKKLLYRIETNPRSPERSQALRQACVEVTRRELWRDGRLLVFEAVDPPGQ